MKIHFIGTGSSLNKGDAAMQVSIKKSLSKVFTGADFSIQCDDLENDLKRYSEFVCVNKSNFHLPFMLLRTYLYKLFHVNSLLNYEELKSISEADLIILTHGDTLTEDYGILLLLMRYMYIYIAKLLKKPVVLYAQSVGPFKKTRLISKYFMDKIDLILVRERLSYDLLMALGIPSEKMFLTADSAFLLETASKKRLKKLIDIEKIDKRKKLVGINISPIISKYYYDTHKNQIFNLIANFADYVIDKYDVNIVFIPHVFCNNCDDRTTEKAVYNLMKNKSSAFLIKNEHSPQEIKSMIGLCEMIVSSRMHANIGALSQNIPVVAISYSNKSPGIMSTLGLKNYVINAKNLSYDELIDKFGMIWKNKKVLSNRIKNKMKIIKKKSFSNAVLTKRFYDEFSSPLNHKSNQF